MVKDCHTCIYKEGACYPSLTIFDKDKTCKSYRPDYEGYIADLENKIADIKANCDYVLEGKEVEYREERNKLCADFENMKATLESKIAELKEKLKEKLNTVADKDLSFVAKFDALEKENAELKKWQKDTIKARGNDYIDWSRKKDQLTKAKEIIKDLMSFSVQLCDCRHTVDFEKTREQAEQFLKETEKC